MGRSLALSVPDIKYPGYSPKLNKLSGLLQLSCKQPFTLPYVILYAIDGSLPCPVLYFLHYPLMNPLIEPSPPEVVGIVFQT